jgi:glycosyltransferase involved in cell wall biosynthesis
LAANRPDAHLVFAGDGSSRLALEKQAAESGCANHIHFLGMVNRADLPDLLHDADLFLSASTTETQCLAMVEAIASGLPVVAVLDPAFEGILADGVNGRISSRDVEPFSAAVGDLLADRPARQSFSQASVELSRKFSMEAQAASLVGLYRDAVGMIL